jgi:hypothetical protein
LRDYEGVPVHRNHDAQLMAIRVDTLFRHDANGRMATHNDPDARPAPRAFLGWTAESYILRLGVTVPDAIADHVADVVRSHPPALRHGGNPSLLQVLRGALTRHAPVTGEEAGPAFCFPEPAPTSAHAVQITEANVELVRESYPWLLTELREWWPCFAVVRDGKAVSVCFSSRIGTAAAESGVDTLEDYRGRGYASDVTSAWRAAIRASGREPLYSTSWENLASQAVARRLGLFMFGADVTLF